MHNETTAPSQQGGRKVRRPRGAESVGGLRGLVVHLQAAREAGYRRVVGMVHDEILARLVRVSWDLDAVGKDLRRTGEDQALALLAASQDVQSVIKAAARIRAELIPPLLEHCGLDAAITSALVAWKARHGGGCRFATRSGASRIESTLALELYRIFEEGLVGLTESGDPSHVAIELSSGSRVVRLCFRATPRRQDAFGYLRSSPALLAVRERARHLGGYVVVRRIPTQFISLAAVIPTRA